MIDPKDVTPGYWYVLSNYFSGRGNDLYEIVEVQEDGGVAVILNDDIHTNKFHSDWIFLAPVPDPIGKPEEEIKRLKKEMNLPANASTADVFRNALALAKAAANKARENPE